MTEDTKMPRYRGTKELYAVPMTRGDYVAERGWTLPEDENGGAEGYRVELVDGGKGDDGRASGYISWRPKAEFEQHFRKVDTHMDRVVAEHEELRDRLSKLSVFLGSDAFKELDKAEQDDLRKQHGHMVDYSNVLWSRRKRAGHTPVYDEVG